MQIFLLCFNGLNYEFDENFKMQKWQQTTAKKTNEKVLRVEIKKNKNKH
jgi:hypothetical protein